MCDNFYKLLAYEHIFNFIKKINLKIDIVKYQKICGSTYYNLTSSFHRMKHLIYYPEYRTSINKYLLIELSEDIFEQYKNIKIITGFDDIAYYIIDMILYRL